MLVTLSRASRRRALIRREPLMRENLGGKIYTRQHSRVSKNDPVSYFLLGVDVRTIFKVNEGRPNAVDLLKARSVSMIIYTGTSDAHAFGDEKAIRRNAVTYRVPCITTMSGARAAVEAIASRRRDPIRVWSLQEIHATQAEASKYTSR